MLAYVFWHWRRPELSADAYVARQRDFHAALGAAPPDGFRVSRSARAEGLPWANGGGEAFEDWYLVDGSAALDPLNDAAVSASRQLPHDAAAAAAAGGTAGLYRLRLGEADGSPALAYWFAKPEGMSYGALWEAMRPIVTRTRGAHCGRAMTLGPTPDFGLHRPAGDWDAGGFDARRVALRSIWPA
jgi:hypothetical protein